MSHKIESEGLLLEWVFIVARLGNSVHESTSTLLRRKKKVEGGICNLGGYSKKRSLAKVSGIFEKSRSRVFEIANKSYFANKYVLLISTF